ncbi:MAG: hypothetical protein ACRD0M_12875, partial [Acidimicrobiales bacterium]
MNRTGDSSWPSTRASKQHLGVGPEGPDGNTQTALDVVLGVLKLVTGTQTGNAALVLVGGEGVGAPAEADDDVVAAHHP